MHPKRKAEMFSRRHAEPQQITPASAANAVPNAMCQQLRGGTCDEYLCATARGSSQPFVTVR